MYFRSIHSKFVSYLYFLVEYISLLAFVYNASSTKLYNMTHSCKSNWELIDGPDLHLMPMEKIINIADDNPPHMYP